jgi:hypothetical protein
MGGLEAKDSVSVVGGPTATSVWVLSIPSFEWTQLPVVSKTMATDPRGRVSPKCQAIGDHYIFLYGGRNALNDFINIICDSKANAAFLLDVNTLTWTDEFTPNEGRYEIPPNVIELIGGDKNGGSTKKGPPNGWSDSELETVMTLKAEPTATDKPRLIPGRPKPNVGAIAGGTVAGVVAVSLGLLGAMVLRRRHQSRRSQLPPDPTGVGNPVELMGQNPVSGAGVFISEFPSVAVTSEMDAGYGNGQWITQR